MSDTYRLMIDFKSLEALRSFCETMEDRTELPDNAVVREWDTQDETRQNGRRFKFIFSRRDRTVTDEEVVYPTLSPKWEKRSLKNRMEEL